MIVVLEHNALITLLQTNATSRVDKVSNQDSMSILLEAGAHCVLIEGRHWNHAPSLAMSVYGKCRELIVLKKITFFDGQLTSPIN